METRDFDHLARSMANGLSRRSILRRAAGSAIVSPLALVGISTAAAQGNKDKDKDKGRNKDKGTRAIRALKATREAREQVAAGVRGIRARGTRSAVTA